MKDNEPKAEPQAMTAEQLIQAEMKGLAIEMEKAKIYPGYRNKVTELSERFNLLGTKLKLLAAAKKMKQ